MGASDTQASAEEIRGAYKYHALQEPGPDGRAQKHALCASHGTGFLRRTVAASFVVAFVYLAISFLRLWPLRRGSPSTGNYVSACDTPERGFQCYTSLSHSWGQYSPFFSVPSKVVPGIPGGCNITFVQLLSRHGARDPTEGKTELYNETISRIHKSVHSYGPGFEFLESYRYALGADRLTVFGQQELVNSGIKFYKRYRSLASKVLPFVRASGQERVVVSALNWTQGLHLSRLADNITDPYPYEMLVIPEGRGVNNSLNHGLCTAFEVGPYSDVGTKAQKTWLEVFAPPIAARLNENLPGANLTDEDTVSIMDLCPFNTVASATGHLSRFCRLFTEDEWHDYAYYQSVGKWYGYGPGNALGPTQGVGFVNELIARLTGTAVHDRTSSNATLDGDPATFPLRPGGRGALYADFSHDNDMTAVVSALGLYKATPPLSTSERLPPDRVGGYSAAWTVPFAARVYVEKMTCAETRDDEELVRILVNDRVVPLQDCGADAMGRCRLSRFIESLDFARRGGRWDQCFT
ncbi:hypothetical protein VTK73DRAFT_8304 [Phialemonium thermophilum]|uniref:Phytase A n=1 Tax=Phialemonium thermophilum TaxID=223376 RepID=A0ABR3W956_9PEZI